MTDVVWEGPVWPKGTDALAHAWQAVRRGETPDAVAVAEALEACEAPWPPAVSKEPVEPLHTVPPNETFTRLALDIAPAAGEDAPRVVLAGWHATLDLARADHRALWVQVVAMQAFVPASEEDRQPVKSWLQDGRRVRKPGREGIAAVARVPPVPWRLHAEGDRMRLTPCVPLFADWVPEGPVDVSGVPGVVGGPVDGGVLFARMVPSTSGWTPRAAVCLPECPPASCWHAWFAEMAVPQLLHNPSLLVEDLLRRGGHLLAARAHRWAWSRAA